jgi:isopentenyldiphosphate isomerase
MRAGVGHGATITLATALSTRDDRGMSAEDEVEIVDETGKVVEVTTRARMRAENLRHRAVGVIVRTTAGDVVVHRRAAWKDVWPQYWDLAFGGVLEPGESWRDGARRELAEEAGVEADLVEAGGGAYEDDDVRVIGRIFFASHDGPFTFVDGEVDEIAFVPWSELRAWTATRTCCPDTLSMVLPLLPDA